MKVWAGLKTVRQLLTITVVAFLLLFALTQSPLWPRSVATADEAKHGEKPVASDKHKSGEKHTATDKHAPDAQAKDAPTAHEEKNALHHVMDTDTWEFFDTLGLHEWHLPNILGLQITKFMLLEVIAALLIIAIYIPLARRMKDGQVVRGSFFNFFEVFLTFVREQIAKPGVIYPSKGELETELGRKRTIQILEFFDRVGHTRRIRDAHVLRGESAFPPLMVS